MTLNPKEKAAIDRMNVPEDRSPEVTWAHVVQSISRDESLPFDQAQQLAQQRFPSLWAQTAAGGGTGAAVGNGEMAPADAAAKFRDMVRDRMAADSCDLTTAWNRVSNDSPDLYRRMFDKAPTLPNGGARSGAGGTYCTLTGCNVEQISPAQAKAAFDKEVNRLMESGNLGHITAWNKTKQTYPELLKRAGEDVSAKNAMQAQELSAPLANALTGGVVAPRAAKPFNLVALGLPANATDDEYDAAWLANGRQTVDRRSQPILTSMVALLMKKYGYDALRAKREASERYPELWKVAGDKAAEPPRKPDGTYFMGGS